MRSATLSVAYRVYGDVGVQSSDTRASLDSIAPLTFRVQLPENERRQRCVTAQLPRELLQFIAIASFGPPAPILKLLDELVSRGETRRATRHG